MEIFFRNVHALVKKNKPFTDFQWLCELDGIKGCDIGTSYRNGKSAKRFLTTIASYERLELAKRLKNAQFLSITCDGSTDSATMEQEIIFARASSEGKVETLFIGICTPNNASAEEITNVILQSLRNIDNEFDEDFIRSKVAGFGCDGAAVMLGKKGGVATRLSRIQPSLITVHCYAHR